MFNNFYSTGLYDIYEKHKRLLFKIGIGILLLVIFIIGLNLFKKENNQYHQMEQELINSVKKYEYNRGNIDNQYIDAYTLINGGYLTKLTNEVGFECNQASGVLVKVSGNKKDYIPYLICGDYYSTSITNIINKDTKDIELLGDKLVTINTKDEYQESGYESSYDVETNGFVAASPGIYTIEYMIFNGEEKTSDANRMVIVSNAPSQANIPTISRNGLYISLNGAQEITLNRGTKYQELGATAKDTEDGDLTKEIEVSGNVDTSKINDYEITYSVRNSKGMRISITRIIKVVAAPANISYTYSTNTNSYTSDNVRITLKINGSDYYYTVLPNNTRTYSRTVSYTANYNGSYNFILYDHNGNYQTAKVNVNNIYKGTPSGSCSATVKNGKTTVTVTPYTNKDYIVGYKYLLNKVETAYLPNTSYISNYETSYAKVTIKDMVGNIGTINCTIIGNNNTPAGQPIMPESSAKIIAQSSSDTLKVWVEEKKGLAGKDNATSVTYYQTRVWVANPTKQIKKATTSGWGTNLEPIKTMLDKKTQSDNLTNKIVVGINGSGFYRAGYWEPPAMKYNFTTEGSLVITNGVVIRNWYEDAYRNVYTHGIDNNGNLQVYYNPTSLSTNARKELFNNIINSGIKDTFSFWAPIIVKNGSIYDKMGSFKSDNNIRQAWCQIDKNNFVILTNKHTAPQNGFNGQQQANILLALGCQTAINMDGGGSASLYFKNKGSATGNVIVNSGDRAIADTLYFTEQ